MTQWREVRCPSPDCDKADRGGRLLFTERDGLVVKAGRSGSVIVEGTAIGAVCRCGAKWKNPRLEGIPDGAGVR